MAAKNRKLATGHELAWAMNNTSPGIMFRPTQASRLLRRDATCRKSVRKVGHVAELINALF